ncbi:hypothetical protein Syun_018480 [Stephania yunnanensis]|uniref:Uncharacterized protein n=1 Tax=Stephania yunnanensis TaxID=152371 RepID=A0AAP0NVV6_9MAGN
MLSKKKSNLSIGWYLRNLGKLLEKFCGENSTLEMSSESEKSELLLMFSAWVKGRDRLGSVIVGDFAELWELAKRAVMAAMADCEVEFWAEMHR